ncbi:TPD1 protein-like protein 1 [Hibiscus syriacus]|uniref:TPD1 protein-like protein 1 n=1 Tax=Hibiscus syriacus TaxID=106335 RepID=A0A6A2WF41_HIBSY|nr:protein TAPETUM DETERMINANT 1-like [Hibiscus syriacus]KAE8657153.1 TPD1 protein-like protein 1 [Hibiscus syriacus]
MRVSLFSPMNRRFLLVLSLFSFAVLFLFLVALFSGQGKNINGSFDLKLLRVRFHQRNINTLFTPHRKLLRTVMAEPNRIRGEKCSKADIEINQGPTAPLPCGIPTYTVEILNICATGCDISGIHVTCGWFSSAHLINPNIFKRLSYNDCLVNDGKPLINGGVIEFQYANTFSYPLSVSSVVCS